MKPSSQWLDLTKPSPFPASRPLKGHKVSAPESAGHWEKLGRKQGGEGGRKLTGVRRRAQGYPASAGSPGRPFRTTLAPEGQDTLCPTHPLLLLINGHSGSEDCASPSPQTLCLEIDTLPQTLISLPPTQAVFPTNAHSKNFSAST